MEVEDDVFFADLSKRISLLIMDDDEDSVSHSPSVSLQAFSQAIHPTTQSTFFYEQNSRRESKGTGVFIPRSSHPRRKNSQGRFTSSSSNTKFHRQSENSKGLPHAPYSNTASYNSFNVKRC